MDTTGMPQQAPPMRAADSDRAATVHVLQDAVARGLLTADEGSDRMAAAFAAVHLRDLAPLTADLPAATPARSGAPGWRPLGVMAWEQVRTTVAGARAGGPAAVRLAIAAVVALVLLATLVSLVHGLADGPDWGGPGFGDRGWDGPGRD